MDVRTRASKAVRTAAGADGLFAQLHPLETGMGGAPHCGGTLGWGVTTGMLVIEDVF